MYTRILFLLAGAFIGLCAAAQNSPATGSDGNTNLAQLVTNSHKEKIILQTDRSVYAAGEKIWFKALLLNALSNKLASFSKNLFVDLVDNNNKVYNTLVLDAAQLKTDGAIKLNDTLPGGYYWLRSYTQQMLNHDTSAIFIQPIFVLNLNDNKSQHNAALPSLTINQNSDTQVVVRFFPERYTLIPGVNSTGVVQITDAAGNSVTAEADIVTGNDSIVGSFATNKFGLGLVSFFATPSQKYSAIVHLPGQPLKYPLPPFDAFAAQISVGGQNSDVIRAIVTLEDSVYSLNYTTYILALSGDSICYAGKGKGMYQAIIPLKNFGAGVATLLLLDSSRRILSERKVFIDKPGYSLNIKTNKEYYTARDSVALAIDVKDTNGKPLVASLSVSVQPQALQQISDDLTADTLQPASLPFGDWLMKQRSNLSLADIGLFMLAEKPLVGQAITKGSDTIEGSIAPLRYLLGKITNKKHEPLPNRVVTEVSGNKGFQFFDVDTTKANGKFLLHLPPNSDSMVVKVQVTDMNNTLQANDKIIIDTFPFPKFNTPAFLQLKFVSSNIVALKKLAAYRVDTTLIGIGKEWLKPVIVHAKAKPDYDESKRVSKFSHVLSGSMLKEQGLNAVGDAVLFMPGVVENGYQGMRLMGSMGRGQPVVILNGSVVPVNDLEEGKAGDPVVNYLNSLDPASVDFIEVTLDDQLSSSNMVGNNGAIIINSKWYSDEAAGLKIFSPKTYHAAPVFPMPHYSNAEEKNSKTPDFRTTIYWNGNVITNINGQSKLNFYTADNPGTYIITITGITANGSYIYERKSIIVR